MTQRTIKFRAWYKKAKRFLSHNEPYLYWCVSPDGKFCWGDEGGGFYESDDCELTISTGLHDKNGKEIWEGDVVRIEHWRENPPKDTPMRHDIETVAVKWQIASFNIRLERYLNGDTYEVIGNIYSGLLPEYENPDMIESWKNITNKPYQNPSKDIPSVKKLDERLD